jgi:hypothetical protein
VVSQNDSLLVPEGQTITPLLLVRLKNHARFVGVREPIVVEVTESAEEPQPDAL